MDRTVQTLSLPESPREFGFYVDGEYVADDDRDIFERSSPGHDVPVTRIPKCTEVDLDSAVAAARVAFEDRRWSGLSVADSIRSRAEVAGCAGMYEYASGVARSLYGDSLNNLGNGMFGLVTREPVGVVGVITPWNFPFLILCERVPYILAAGCTIVSKPSEMTSATSLILAEILTHAGLPDGCMNVVTGSGSAIGQKLIEHPDIDMVSFSGSTNIGRNCVHAAAGNFKKLGLELDGKNPQIVFADADLEDAADGVAFGIGFNTGQCCVAGSRLIVERGVADRFGEMVAEKLSKAVVGDPFNATTRI